MKKIILFLIGSFLVTAVFSASLKVFFQIVSWQEVLTKVTNGGERIPADRREKRPGPEERKIVRWQVVVSLCNLCVLCDSVVIGM